MEINEEPLQAQRYLRFHRARAEVRRADDVRLAKERRLGVRFLGEDVKAYAAELTRFDPFDDRVHIINAAARAVDEEGAVFHRVDFFFADEVARRVGEGNVNGKVIDEWQDFGERIVNLNVDFLRALRREIGVEGDNVHLERFTKFRNGLTDASHANNAERLAVELATGELFAIPATFHERLVRCADIATHGKHEREGLLGGGRRVAARRVHNDDPMPGRGFKIDIVDANAGASDRLAAYYLERQRLS